MHWVRLEYKNGQIQTGNVARVDVGDEFLTIISRDGGWKVISLDTIAKIDVTPKVEEV